jgi:DNA repair protein RecN (Recombination protein N)
LNSGKSRAFINDTPVTLEILKEVSSHLLDIHSQHDNLLLGTVDFQLEVVDAFADNGELLLQYKEKYSELQKTKKELEALKETLTSAKKEQDYNNYLYNELKEAQLKEGEQEEAEAQVLLLENAIEVKENLRAITDILSENELSTNRTLQIAGAHFNTLSKLVPKYSVQKQRIIAIQEELKDIIKETERELDKIELNPMLLSTLQARLDTIYKLQKKHGTNSVSELISIQARLQNSLENFENIENNIANLTKKLNEDTARVIELAEHISSKRRAVFKKIESSLAQLLEGLGMPNAQFIIDHQTMPVSNTGIDKIQFLFTANKGLAPSVLKNNASGGEFSRLMFALKYMLAQKKSFPTVIFDEIDTGISGEIASKMGDMMRAMAKDHQIFTITHLHQIAAKGQFHFFVYKHDTDDKTLTSIKLLNAEDRIQKIAEMIGGSQPSALAIENAKELLSA